MAGGFQAKLAGAGAIQQPACQFSVFDQRAADIGDAFAIERLGAQAAHPMRIVDDGDARREDAKAHFVFEEGDAASDGGAGNSAGEMTQ